MANAAVRIADDEGVSSGFKAKVRFAAQADMFVALARAYFKMFGLSDAKVMRQFTLYANQTRSMASRRASEFDSQLEYFRDDEKLSKAMARTEDADGRTISEWTITVDVKKWFLERLPQFGIGIAVNKLDGSVKVTRFEPLPMIDASELRIGDVITVGGRASVSTAIMTATGSAFSHAAIYDGQGSVYEALAQGIVKTPLGNALSGTVRASAFRPLRANAFSGKKAVDYIRRQVGRPYDYSGAINSGISWKTAFVVLPLLGFKLGQTVGKAIVGEDASFFCSEAVAAAYVHAGTPIADTRPRNTVPGALARSRHLAFVGYLRHLPE